MQPKRSWRINFRILFSVIGLAAVIASGLIWHHKTKPYHFLEVTPGILYRSGILKPHNLEKVLRQHGIKTVVNLRPIDDGNPPEWYRKETEICKKHGVEHIDIPMRPETPPAKKQIKQWLSLLDDKSRLPVLVHCTHGVVRTGMLVAVYEIEYLHADNAKTLKALPMFGHELWKPKRKPMRDFILNYNSRGEKKGYPQ